VTIPNYKVFATSDRLNADEFGGSSALQLALEEDVWIALCAWGAGLATDGSSRLCRACNLAWELGLAIVTSSGNKGMLTAPADANGIIIVGATDKSGHAVPDYSGRGPTQDGRVRPHVVAPGATEGDGLVSCRTDGTVGNCGCGTSFAAAHVSGTLALLRQREPALTPDALLETLVAFAVPLEGVDRNAQGHGLIVLPTALSLAG
jgi:serine protease AprX